MNQRLQLGLKGTEVLGNLTVKGIVNAMKGFAQMVGKDIRMTEITIRQIPAKEVPEVVGGADSIVVGIYLSFSGAASGHLMLVQQPELAFAITDILMGNPPGTTTDFESADKSALGEVGNITGSFFLNAVADALGISLLPSPPTVILDITGAILDIALAEILQESDDVVVAETAFAISGCETRGNFLVMPSPGFVRMTMERCGARM